MSTPPSIQPSPEQEAERKKDERERVSAEEILENAVDLSDYGVLEAIGDGVSAVGEFIGGLADFG